MVFVIVLLNVELLWEVVLSPVVFGLFVAIQVYDEATLLVSGMLTVFPLQMVAVDALVIAGVGFTVTVTVCGVPAQPPAVAVGVTVYVTVCAAEVVFVITSVSVAPLC